jgi:hypothetical protein
MPSFGCAPFSGKRDMLSFLIQLSHADDERPLVRRFFDGETLQLSTYSRAGSNCSHGQQNTSMPPFRVMGGADATLVVRWYSPTTKMMPCDREHFHEPRRKRYFAGDGAETPGSDTASIRVGGTESRSCLQQCSIFSAHGCEAFQFDVMNDDGNRTGIWCHTNRGRMTRPL